MSLDNVCLVEIHSYHPTTATGGENNAWFVYDSLPVGQAERHFSGTLFKTEETKQRLNGTIVYVRKVGTEMKLSADQLGLLHEIVGVEAPRPTEGWARRTTTVLLASGAEANDVPEPQIPPRSNELVKKLCDALAAAMVQGESQWDIVPITASDSTAPQIKKDSLGNLVVILCDDAHLMRSYIDALMEPAFLRSESLWQRARSARDRCAVRGGHYDELESGVGDLKSLARGTYAAVNDVVEKIRLEYREMERCRDNLATEVEQLERANLKGFVQIRIRDANVAIQEADVRLEDAERDLDNAKWALAQKQWEASDYLNRMLMVVQVILIVAAIWPQAFAVYIDKATGGSESWPGTWTAFGYMLTVGLALSLLALVVVFATKAAFNKWRGR